MPFPAWKTTCAELAAAIRKGPGLVVLVGPEGSGKTTSLAAFATAIGDQHASVRLAGQPLQSGVTVDMVDAVDAEALDTLVAEPDFAKVRVLAIVPERRQRVVEAYPGARIVQMRPMESRDVRTMIEVRRSQIRLPRDAFTLKAISKLGEFCGGNPRALDRLIMRASHLARVTKSARIGSAGVDTAKRQLETAILAWRDAQPGQAFVPVNTTIPAPAAIEPHIEAAQTAWRQALPGQVAGRDEHEKSQPEDPLPVMSPVEQMAPDVAEPPAIPKGGTSAWTTLRASPLDLAQIERLRRAKWRVRGGLATGAAVMIVVAGVAIGNRAGIVAFVGGAHTAPVGREIPAVRGLHDQAGQPTAAPIAPPEPVQEASRPSPPVEPLDAELALTPIPAPESEPAPAIVEAMTLPPPRPAPEPPRNPEEATRLLMLGKAMLSIGQVGDARKLFEASARLGNAEAALLNADGGS